MVKKILYYIVNTLSVVIIVAAVLVLLSVVLTKQGDTPSILGRSVFRVVSGSMEPSISANDLIVVRKTDASDIREGDVISFYSSDPELRGAVNTHRVAEVLQDNGHYSFVTKGDANIIEDEYPVRDTDVIGVVVFVSGFLGHLSRVIANPLVFIPVILVPLLVILISNLVKAARIAKAAVREEEERALAEALEEVKRRKAEQAAVKAAEADDTPASGSEENQEQAPKNASEESLEE